MSGRETPVPLTAERARLGPRKQVPDRLSREASSEEEEPLTSPSYGTPTVLWRSVYRNSAQRHVAESSPIGSLEGTARTLFNSPQTSSLYPDLSKLSEGMAGNEGAADPVAVFLFKANQRPTTVISEANRVADKADSEWEIGNVEHLSAWVQSDPDRVLRMLDSLRVERDQAVMYTEEGSRNDLSDNIVAGEVRRLRVTNANLTETNGNLVSQIQGIGDRIEQLETENTGLRELARAPSLATNTDENRNKKLTPKMRDPPVFTGQDEVKYEDWEIQIQDRFQVNHDHYPTDAAKIVFMCNSTGGEALGHIRTRREKGATDPYTEPQQVFDHLSDIYSEVDRAGKARREYRSTYQGPDGRFAAYKSNMLRLAGILKYQDAQVRDDICDQMATRLKDALRMNPQMRHTASLKEMFNWLQQLDNDQLADAERKKTSAARRSQGREPAATQTETKGNTRKTTYNPNSYKRDAARSDRLELERRLGLCHNCHKPGHISAMCPDKAQKSVTVNSIDDINHSKN